MLLRREREEDLILYDDHGEAWKITLESAVVSVGTGNTDVAGATGPRAIEFLGADGESIRVRYDGAAMREEELLFDEVVVHFMKAQD